MLLWKQSGVCAGQLLAYRNKISEGVLRDLAMYLLPSVDLRVLESPTDRAVQINVYQVSIFVLQVQTPAPVVLGDGDSVHKFCVLGVFGGAPSL